MKFHVLSLLVILSIVLNAAAMYAGVSDASVDLPQEYRTEEEDLETPSESVTDLKSDSLNTARLIPITIAEGTVSGLKLLADNAGVDLTKHYKLPPSNALQSPLVHAAGASHNSAAMVKYILALPKVDIQQLNYNSDKTVEIAYQRARKTGQTDAQRILGNAMDKAGMMRPKAASFKSEDEAIAYLNGVAEQEEDLIGEGALGEEQVEQGEEGDQEEEEDEEVSGKVAEDEAEEGDLNDITAGSSNLEE